MDVYVQAGGYLMIPILLFSVAAAAIVAERIWSLQSKKIVPPTLVAVEGAVGGSLIR